MAPVATSKRPVRQCAPPRARHWQAGVFNPDTNELIIAYGRSQEFGCENDCWALNVKDLEMPRAPGRECLSLTDQFM
jgi:hypothetical protein